MCPIQTRPITHKVDIRWGFEKKEIWAGSRFVGASQSIEWLLQNSETVGNISPLSGPNWKPALNCAVSYAFNRCNCTHLHPSILVYLCCLFQWVERQIFVQVYGNWWLQSVVTLILCCVVRLLRVNRLAVVGWVVFFDLFYSLLIQWVWLTSTVSHYIFCF